MFQNVAKQGQEDMKETGKGRKEGEREEKKQEKNIFISYYFIAGPVRPIPLLTRMMKKSEVF